MSNRISIFMSIVFVIYSINGSAQELNIGDKVPDLSSNTVINHSSASLRLSDIKKKWVLLDFWSTTCASCVASFEKMDKLQQKFDNDLQIVFINREPRDFTVAFFDKKKKLKKAGVPYITGDSVFKKAFPHSFSPYYVLLDSNRKVVAFPEHEYVSNGPIEALVRTNKVALGRSVSPIRFEDHQTILNVLDSASISKAEAFFILTKGVEGLAAYRFLSTNSMDLRNRFTLAGVPAHRLFSVVMSELTGKTYPRNAVVIESKLKDSFSGPSDAIENAEWLKKNAYAVDILVSASETAQLMTILKDNLEKHFKVVATIEKRKVPCFVLKRIGNQYTFGTKGANPYRKAERTDTSSTLTMINKPFADFADYLRQYFDAMINTRPFVDATGILGNVDMTFDTYFFEKFQKKQLSNVNMAIAKFGLVVMEEDYLTDVVVIKDKK